MLKKYAVVLLTVLLTTALRYALHGALGTRSIYTFYFVAVTISAVYGGLGPGVAALGLSALIATCLFVPPEFVLTLRSAQDWIGLAAFLVTGLVIIGLTARVRAAREASHASEEQYRSLVETSQDIVWAFDLEGRVTFISQQASRTILGYDAAEIVGRSWSDFVAPEELADHGASFAAVVRGETMRHVPLTAIRKDGVRVDLLVTAIPRRAGAEGVTGVTGTAVDVTGQRIQERNLELFRLLMDQSADGILIIDDTSEAILDANQTICRWLGYRRDELLGRSTQEIVHPHPTLTWEGQRAEAYRLGHSADPAAPPPVLEIQYRRRDGVALPREVGFRYVEVHGLEYIVAVARDVSERKRMEQQLQQSLKMEGIGRLAGGIAHDFNNLLTAIGGYTELSLISVGPEHEAAADLAEIQAAAERAAGLTRQLLAFARRQIIQPRPLSLNDLVGNTEALLERLLGEDIKLLVRLQAELWPVTADPGQFEQILVNLAVNARDAMPSGGNLTFETANVTLSADYSHSHPEVVPGDYVRLTVSDTGVGMSETVQQHVFEPFFTTKELGKGTGLGLATCHGIVKQSGGHIWLYSEPGQGATFKIYLPRAKGLTPTTQSPPESGAAPEGGTETILLLEDDALVRRFATAALRRAGYRVIETDAVGEAIRLAEELGPGVHMLFTDVVMPGMNGPEVARRIREAHPRIRVLYASGYTDDTIVHHGVVTHGVTLLQKPYSVADLLAKVRTVLDEPPAGS